MTSLAFRVLGIPRPDSKRSAVINGKARRYVSKPVKQWRAAVAFAYMEAGVVDAPFDGPVHLECLFYLPRPQRHFNAKGELLQSAPAYPTTKPDTENLLKPVKDELTSCNVWRDDAQVVNETVMKRYASCDECGVVVCVEEVT